MKFKYRVRKKIGLLKSNEKVNYHAVPVYRPIVTTRALAEEIGYMTGISAPDMFGAIEALSERIEHHLRLGEKVQLDNLGIFSLSITSKGYDSPEAVTPSRVVAKRYCFLPAKALKERLSKVAFEREV